MKSISQKILASALFSTIAAVTAFAHVTLETREARAGTPYKAVLKVPHGCDGSTTVKVRAQIPEGVIAVKPMPKAGWQLETVKGKYGKAYPYYHGMKLSDGVKEIVWSGGKLPDEFYDEFVFAGFLADDLKPGPLYIPVTQECEKGEARWTDIPAPGQDAHALKAPAPAVIILAQHAGHSMGGAAPAGGTTYKAGSLVIEAPWARATPGGAQVAGGFMKIMNTGKEPDRLVGGSVPFAGRFEVHEMAMDGGVMKMREVKGLEIKPGETVELKPGGYHVMFMDLKSGLKDGETVKGTLVFEKAGKVDVEFKVGPVGGGAPADAAGGGHKHH